MNAPKMIVTDLDGTLLDINKKCSSKAKEYLQKLKNKGKIVVIATGRVLDSAVKVTDGAVFADYIISNSGGMIYDLKNKKEIFRSNISKENVNKICLLYDEKFEYIDICDSMSYNRYTNDFSKEITYEKIIKDKQKFLKTCDNIVHIVISLKRNSYIKEITKKLKEETSDLDIKIMQASSTDKKYIEIYMPNISKYKAIEKVAEIEGIKSKEIIAFGDSLNDIDMLKNCGIGVVMENGLDEVKEVANHITLSNNEDGVYHFLEKTYGGNNETSSTKS